MHIDLEQAEKAIAAARKEAVKLQTKMCIAVVDFGANLRAFVRMDDAWVGSIDIAIKKAKTSGFFTLADELGKPSQPGKPLYGIEHSNGGLITFPGGLPIIQNGELFGAIGVSGSSVENDAKVAAAGCKVLGESQLADDYFARMMSSWELSIVSVGRAGRRKPGASVPSRELCCRPSHAYFPRLFGEIALMPSSNARKAKAERASKELFENVTNPFCGTLPDDLTVERTGTG